MKQIAITIGAAVVLLFAILVFNVWRAGMTPVTAAPGPLEIGRQQLHDQLEQSKKRESDIEQQDWNSITLLRELIKAHQERIDKLTGNSQAGEIVAWDKESVTRIESRIADLIAKESEQRAPSGPDSSVSQPALNATGHSETQPAASTPKPSPSGATGTSRSPAQPVPPANSINAPRSNTPKPFTTSPKPATVPSTPPKPGGLRF